MSIELPMLKSQIEFLESTEPFVALIGGLGSV